MLVIIIIHSLRSEWIFLILLRRSLARFFLLDIFLLFLERMLVSELDRRPGLCAQAKVCQFSRGLLAIRNGAPGTLNPMVLGCPG